MEADAIAAASAALPLPQRRAFAELGPATCAACRARRWGPGSLHRIIAVCQQSFLTHGVIAFDPSPKHGKKDAVAARAKQARPA